MTKRATTFFLHSFSCLLCVVVVVVFRRERVEEDYFGSERRKIPRIHTAGRRRKFQLKWNVKEKKRDRKTNNKKKRKKKNLVGGLRMQKRPTRINGPYLRTILLMLCCSQGGNYVSSNDQMRDGQGLYSLLSRGTKEGRGRRTPNEDGKQR